MTLYHYTDQNGFLGIFNNQELWASRIQYLNDENEYNLGVMFAIRHLNKLIELKPEGLTKDRLIYYREIIPSIRNENYCVCSLTENGDLLSQWRGYSMSLGGYSIGFKHEVLKDLVLKQGFDLIKCIYDPHEQDKIISDMIEKLVYEFMNEHPLFDPYAKKTFFKSGDVFLDRLAEISPKIKDVSFAEEAEWRIIGRVPFETLEFRPGKSTLTPYCKIKIAMGHKRDFHKLIAEIIVGHTPHPELALKSTEAFIIKCFSPPEEDECSSPIDIKISRIPFRNW